MTEEEFCADVAGTVSKVLVFMDGWRKVSSCSFNEKILPLGACTAAPSKETCGDIPLDMGLQPGLLGLLFGVCITLDLDKFRDERIRYVERHFV